MNTRLLFVLLPMLLAATPSPAQDAPEALTLTEAARLALAAQPLLEAQRADLRRAREEAVAAAQLPDPVLIGGVRDVPLGGAERYSLTENADTQLEFGLRQEFPGAGKRALRGARLDADAARLAAELDEQTRMLAREAGLAWLDVWQARQSQELVRASLAEAERQARAVEIAYRSGRAAQAELLGARVAVELARDRLDGLEQQEWHARNQLRRWIGADAERPVEPSLPPWPAPDLPALLAHFDEHPHLAVQSRAVGVAEAELALARADYRPDWSLQLGYGHRREFTDYASLQVEIGLPFFTARRQDRTVAARAAEVSRAEHLREDARRQHRAEIQLNVADWQRLQQRLARYDAAILRQAQQRLDAALNAYAAGSGTLAGLLDARIALLDARLERLELELDAARHQVNLQYFAITGAAS